MNVEVQTPRRSECSQDAYLVVINVSDTLTISISPACVEVETFDENGNRLSQQYVDTPDLPQAIHQARG